MNDLSRNHLDFNKSEVLEPTLADAIAAVAADTTILLMKRRHWRTSNLSSSRFVDPDEAICIVKNPQRGGGPIDMNAAWVL